MRFFNGTAALWTSTLRRCCSVTQRTASVEAAPRRRSPWQRSGESRDVHMWQERLNDYKFCDQECPLPFSAFTYRHMPFTHNPLEVTSVEILHIKDANLTPAVPC